MIYTKDPNMTYVEMCIYFDNHILTVDRNDTLLYEYLYHICYMLACKRNFFLKYEDYDYFAHYAAGVIYLRYPSKEDLLQNKPYKKIKSILNYTKATLYPTKVAYQQEFFNQIFTYEVSEYLIENSRESIQQSYLKNLYEVIIDIFEVLPTFIQKIINQTIYKNDKLMVKQLYMSCLLTIIDNMTINNNLQQKIKKKSKENEKEKALLVNLKKEKNNNIIVWHLDKKYRNYIKILVTKIKADIYNELVQAKDSFKLSENELDGIVKSAFMPNNFFDLYEGD